MHCFKLLEATSKRSSLEKEEISSDNAPVDRFVLVGYLMQRTGSFVLAVWHKSVLFLCCSKPYRTACNLALGLSDSFCLLADFSAAVICQWLIFSAICLLIGTIGSAAHIVPAFLIGRTLVSCFVCAFFSCALELFYLPHLHASRPV